MRKSSSQHKNGFSVTWLLSGVLLACCLLNSVPLSKAALVCAEERVVELEIDDERSEPRGPDFILFTQIEERSTSQAWHEVQVFTCSLTGQVDLLLNFERGPPSC